MSYFTVPRSISLDPVALVGHCLELMCFRPDRKWKHYVAYIGDRWQDARNSCDWSESTCRGDIILSKFQAEEFGEHVMVSTRYYNAFPFAVVRSLIWYHITFVPMFTLVVRWCESPMLWIVLSSTRDLVQKHCSSSFIIFVQSRCACGAPNALIGNFSLNLNFDIRILGNPALVKSSLRDVV